MNINYPYIIGRKKFELQYSIGDLVKRNDGRFDGDKFIISSINIKPDTGIVYQGLLYNRSQKQPPVLSHGTKENLDIVEENYYTKLKEENTRNENESKKLIHELEEDKVNEKN